MGIIFPVMGWLAKVMTRNKKATGFFAGLFIGNCSGPMHAFELYHCLFRGASANQHTYMSTEELWPSA